MYKPLYGVDRSQIKNRYLREWSLVGMTMLFIFWIFRITVFNTTHISFFYWTYQESLYQSTYKNDF